MGKIKTPSIAKMICEALQSAVDKEMNSRMLLNAIKKKHSIEDDKQMMDQIYAELERGKESGKFLQVKGTTSRGFFKLNPAPKLGVKKEDPHLVPPPTVVKQQQRDSGPKELEHHKQIFDRIQKPKSFTLDEKRKVMRDFRDSVLATPKDLQIAVSLGVISCFVENLQLDDLESLTSAVYFLNFVCMDDKSNTSVPQMLKAGIAEKILALTKDERFLSVDPEEQKFLSIMTMHIINRSSKKHYSMSGKQRASFVQALLNMMALNNEEVWLYAACSLERFSFAAKKLPTGVTIKQENISRLVTVAENGPSEVKLNLIKFLRWALFQEVKRIPELVDEKFVLFLLFNCAVDEDPELKEESRRCVHAIFARLDDKTQVLFDKLSEPGMKFSTTPIETDEIPAGYQSYVMISDNGQAFLVPASELGDYGL